MLYPRQTDAAAFQLKENSAADEGDAFAGAPSAADTPATVFNNPAGMTQLPGVQVSLGASLIDPTFVFHGGATNAFGQPIAGSTNPDGGHAAMVPYGEVSYQLSPDITVGLALTSPYGLSSYFGPDFVGRYQADKTELETFNFNPAIAWQVAPWLSLGAGVSADYAIGEFDAALNSEVVLASACLLPFWASLDRSRMGFSGCAATTGRSATILAPCSNRSRAPISASLTAVASDTNSTPKPRSPCRQRSPAILPSPADRRGPSWSCPIPQLISLTQKLTPRLTGYANLTWTDWSLLRNLSVYRTSGGLIDNTVLNYKNAVFVSIGASYEVTDQLTLRAGTAFDQSPVRDAYITPRVPDDNRYWLAVGGSYKITPTATIDVGYAHIFADKPSIHELSITGDLLSGYFAGHIDILSVGVHFAL